MFPLGKDILNNNNKAPIKFIIKLISEDSMDLWRIVKFQACVLKEWVGVREGDYRWDTLISRGACVGVGTPTVILYKDTETSSSSWHHQETLQMSVYGQLTTPTAFTRKWLSSQISRTETLINHKQNVWNCTVQYSTVAVCTSPTTIDR